MSNAIDTQAARTIDLDRDELLVIENRAGTRLQVLQGGLWLTEMNSPDDCFAGAGQWLAVEHRGRAIAQSLGRTRVRLFDPPRRGRLHGGVAARVKASWSGRVPPFSR